MRGRLRFVVAGACAALTVALCLLYGRQVRDEAERVRSEALERYGGEVVTLAVASRGLEAGDVVSAQNVAERDWLSDLAPQDAVVDLDDVMGSKVTVPVAAGVPLTTLNFRSDDEAIEVPSGRVALTIPVTDKCALPATADAGTRLVAYEVRDSGARVVSEGLQVLRVSGDQGLGGVRATLTAAVEPDDVAQVLAASAEGTLRLALPAGDVEGLATEPPTDPTNVPAEDSLVEEDNL